MAMFFLYLLYRFIYIREHLETHVSTNDIEKTHSGIQSEPPVVEYLHHPCDDIDISPSIACVNGSQVNLTETEKLKFYSELLTNVRIPPIQKRIFASSSTCEQLGIVLIEVKDGDSPFLLGSLYNIAHIYGGQEYCLTLLIHARHRRFIKKVLKDGNWENVEIVSQSGQPTIHDYNLMLTSPWFFDLFESKFLLITHPDVLLFKKVEPEWFKFDYVGAPWHSKITRSRVGNGGYSLRNMKEHRELIEKIIYKQEHPNGDLNEDIWYSEHIANVPSVEKALEFSVEIFAAQDFIPTGCHKIYAHAGAFEKLGRAFTLFAREFCYIEQYDLHYMISTEGN